MLSVLQELEFNCEGNSTQTYTWGTQQKTQTHGILNYSPFQS